MYLEIVGRLTSGHCLLIHDLFIVQAESFFPFRVAPGLATEGAPHLLTAPAAPSWGWLPGNQRGLCYQAAVPNLYKVPSFSPTTSANPLRSGVNDSSIWYPCPLRRRLLGEGLSSSVIR